MPFRVTTDGGRIRAIPGDAAALVAAGQLDERLFDVTTLLDYGYDDTRRPDLPLIVQYQDAARPTSAAETRVRQLANVNGAAISVSKKNAPMWWNTRTRPDHGMRVFNTGFTKILLNGKRRSTLEGSTAQIGAPVAWQAGFTGARSAWRSSTAGLTPAIPISPGRSTPR